MAKAKSTETSAPVVTEKTIQNEMNLLTILNAAGIQCTTEQIEMISKNVIVKKQGRGKLHYKLGENKLEATTKIALQARIAVENLEDGMTLEDWAAKVAKDSRFVTKQDVSKVIAYYQKDLVELGIISKN
jgi:hypothetical protein